MSREARAFGKLGGALVFGAIAEGGAELAEATGHNKLATGLNIAAAAGTGALQGAVVGSVIPGIGTGVGAAIGAVTGLVTSAFKELAGSARDTAAALKEQHQRIFKGQDVDNSLYEMFRDQKDRKALKNQDRSYFQSQLAQEQKLYNKATRSLERDVGLGGEGLKRFNLREYEKETERLMKLKGREDPEVVRRRNIGNLYTANAKVLREADARIQELERNLESLGKAPLNKAKAAAAQSDVDRLEEALKAFKAPDLTNVNSLASQGYMISEADDVERLNEANKYLHDIWQVTKDIRDAKDTAATYG